MELAKLNVMYGHLEGTDGKFARDPSGYLSIDAGIYEKYGLDVSWRHVQGTEARYQQLESGGAHISLVVGRASLQHFLDTRNTRLLGCVMNSCSYYLIAAEGINTISELKNKMVTCREGPAQGVPFGRLLEERAGLKLSKDLTLQFTDGDQDAFRLLLGGQVQAAWLPRPYAFMAEEKGFIRLKEWSDIVDDPLPITMETTTSLSRERANDFSRFVQAHREGIRYLQDYREEAMSLLETRFGHSPELAAKTFDEYLTCMDDRLTVDFKHLDKLVAQIAPNIPGGAQQVASEWIIPGALRH
jgi:ABC-type nitrate/sulfonate/bicarbonate transport system substrate-binding protein